MSKCFVNNVNEYIYYLKIKKSYISLKTGISENDINNILNGKIEPNDEQMQCIANALGKDMEYFKKEGVTITIPKFDFNNEEEFKKQLNESQKEIVSNLIEMIENADEVLSAKHLVYMIDGN